MAYFARFFVCILCDLFLGCWKAVKHWPKMWCIFLFISNCISKLGVLFKSSSMTSSPVDELKDSADRLLSSLTYISSTHVIAKLCIVSAAPSGLLLCDPGVPSGFHKWWRIISRHPHILIFWIIKATGITPTQSIQKTSQIKIYSWHKI